MLEQQLEILTGEVRALSKALYELRGDLSKLTLSSEGRELSPSSPPPASPPQAPVDDGAFSSVDVVEEEFDFDDLVLRAIQWTERHSEAEMAAKIQQLKAGAGKLSDLNLDQQKQLFVELAP